MTSSLDEIAATDPVARRAITRHRITVSNSARPSAFHDDCQACKRGDDRHRHSFADDELRVSLADDGRVYGRDSAIAYVIARGSIDEARRKAKRAREAQLFKLQREARQSYPGLPGMWPALLLSEARIRFAVRLERAKAKCFPAYAVAPIICAMTDLMREASNRDTALFDSGDDSPVADSPKQAAIMYKLIVADSKQ